MRQFCSHASLGGSAFLVKMAITTGEEETHRFFPICALQLLRKAASAQRTRAKSDAAPKKMQLTMEACKATGRVEGRLRGRQEREADDVAAI